MISPFKAATFLVAYSKVISGTTAVQRGAIKMPYFANLMLIDAFLNLIVYMVCFQTFRTNFLTVLHTTFGFECLKVTNTVSVMHSRSIPLHHLTHNQHN